MGQIRFAITEPQKLLDLNSEYKINYFHKPIFSLRMPIDGEVRRKNQ